MWTCQAGYMFTNGQRSDVRSMEALSWAGEATLQKEINKTETSARDSEGRCVNVLVCTRRTCYSNSLECVVVSACSHNAVYLMILH